MNHLSKKKFFICATEQSGDNIGSELINHFNRNRKYSLTFEGVGGSKMKKIMKKQFYQTKDFKSMGIFELIGSINKYLQIIDNLSNLIIKNKYDYVFTIDSPDFNYRLAKKIKQNGYNGYILQIVAPTVWAWRKNRAIKFSKVFDFLFTIYPFEKKYFEKYKLKTTYIGHPIFHVKYKTSTNKKFIAFLMGSREGELKSLNKYFTIASDYLNRESSNLIIFIPTLPHLKKYMMKITKDWNHQVVIETDQSKFDYYYSKTSFALVCSGTASLEVAKRKIPQLIIYKINLLTYFILLFMVKVKFANIVNIIANEMIIPELVNIKLNKKSFLISFTKLLTDKNSNNLQIKKSNKFINQLILDKPPSKIIYDEFKNLFL